MIYLDNSATTFPKPAAVNQAVLNALKKYGANPGRSGHKMSLDSGKEIEQCREAAAKLFGAGSAKDVVFTLNCTQALNIVLKGLLKPGDHVITSCLEQNAVMRPIHKLREKEVTYTIAQVFPGDDDRTVESFRLAINSKTKLIACMHASNVWGIKLPIEKIAALGKIYGIPVLVDGAQSAGLVPIDIQKTGIDYLCLAGHKGLYGPMGTGVLITSNGDKLDTVIEGGTGTDSLRLCQPKEMPQKLESGTPNMVGISGLRAGIEFVSSKGVENIFNHEHNLILHLYDKLKSVNGAQLYMPRPDQKHFVPLLSFNMNGFTSDEVGKFLDQNGIEVRTGLQCSPLAHQFVGTSDRGVVRVSPSVFNTKAEIDKLVDVLKNYKT